MNCRAWAVRPLGSNTIHITRHGNALKTFCGKRFASVSDYRVIETADTICPDCKTCLRLFRKYEQSYE